MRTPRKAAAGLPKVTAQTAQVGSEPMSGKVGGRARALDRPEQGCGHRRAGRGRRDGCSPRLPPAIVDDVVVDAIRQHWDEVSDQVRLTEAERNGLWRREILNAYVFEGYAANA